MLGEPRGSLGSQAWTSTIYVPFTFNLCRTILRLLLLAFLFLRFESGESSSEPSSESSSESLFSSSKYSVLGHDVLSFSALQLPLIESSFGWGLRIRPAMDEDPQVTINMNVLRWKRIWLRAKQVRFLIALGGHLLQYPISSLLSSFYHLIAFPWSFVLHYPFYLSVRQVVLARDQSWPQKGPDA